MMKQVLGGSCSPARSVPLLTVLWFACLWHENSYVASGEDIDLFLHKYFSFYFLSEETTCWQRLIAGILVFVCFVLFVFLVFWFCFCFCFVLCNLFFSLFFLGWYFAHRMKKDTVRAHYSWAIDICPDISTPSWGCLSSLKSGLNNQSRRCLHFPGSLLISVIHNNFFPP